MGMDLYDAMRQFGNGHPVQRVTVEYRDGTVAVCSMDEFGQFDVNDVTPDDHPILLGEPGVRHDLNAADGKPASASEVIATYSLIGMVVIFVVAVTVAAVMAW